ncbi:hypothetical protein AB0I98_35830 [Streptomyces sp. NPDC050211]|uniref:hypothetical protein n=1 Tax=Streptomyces sp. NPDC050211 TaxID=3154932 RepID=UPI003425343E
MHSSKRLAALTAVAVAVTVALTGITASAAPGAPRTEPVSGRRGPRPQRAARRYVSA